MMDISAAVLEGPRELAVETLQLEDPKPGEVRVDLRATGVCHTDYHRFRGALEVPYPIVLGHEGAGVVTDVGDGVTSLEVGDHVVLWVLPFCRECTYCERGEPYLCARREAVRDGSLLDGTRRLSRDGERINHFYAQSSFASHCVVAEQTAVPVPKELPFSEAALLGCGATTGLGGVTNVAQVGLGESVAVFGCGGVGASTLMGARMVGADPVVVVDVIPDKLAFAERQGATHTVDANSTNPVAALAEITGDGVDYALVGTSKPEVIEQAVASLRKGGTAVVPGTGSAGSFEVDQGDFTYGKHVVGNIGGSVRPHVDIPRFAELAQQGLLDLGAMVSRMYALDEIPQAFEDMVAGEIVRGMVEH